ncbi:MAG: HAD family hydrolase [Simkaniaceae bacterium]|nr:HAD family hydrolase [Candidatus Sacchlamyda saccharinae]
MKGVIAFDIDGTLTHRLDWIDPKVVKFLEELPSRGWHVALLTGRIFSFADRIIQNLNFSYVLSVQNGADILTMPGKESLKRNYFGPEILPIIQEAYGDAAEDFIIYAGVDQGDFCYFRPERFSEKMKPYLKKLESLGAASWQPSDFEFEPEAKFPLIKCFGDEKAMRRVHDILEANPKVEVSMIRDPIDTSLYLVLVTHPEANKGSAAAYLREHFHCPILIAAGDDRNDFKMLKEADISIAIQTAPEDLLAVADIHAKPAGELGILAGVEEAISRANA